MFGCIDGVLLEIYGDLVWLLVDDEDFEEDLLIEIIELECEMILVFGFKLYFEGDEGLFEDEFEFDDFEG